MKTPPLLLGATLLFWGWQTNLLAFSGILAVVLEGSRWVSARWEFSPTDFNRVWNLCVTLFVGAAVYAFTSAEGANAMAGLVQTNSPAARIAALNKIPRAGLLIFQWMPLTFFPIAVAQAFSLREKMDWSTFSWWLRRKRAAQGKGASASDGGLNVTYPYLAATLLAASATKSRIEWFFAGFVLLLGWTLGQQRPRNFPLAAWGVCLVAVVALGFGTQLGFVQVRSWLERLDSALLSRWSGGHNIDPKESRTMIGSIGRLKLSGHIVLRLETEGPPPALLREASYSLFKAPIWGASKRDFNSVTAERDETTWKLRAHSTTNRFVTIATYLDNGTGVLPVPHGIAQLDELPVYLLETNRLGVVRAGAGPGFARFRAYYDGGRSIDGPPDDDDLQVPLIEQPAVLRIADELKLHSQSTNQALRTIVRFFAEQFQYSTWLGHGHVTSRETALAAFLLKTRSGHCEYFATATTLLLREARIPARYAVGYAVQEKKGRQYVVRERHAHAWCLAWIDGDWREIDTTPAAWSQIESSHAPAWEAISDLWSRVWFEFSKWRWGKTEFRKYLLWLVGPLVLLVGARLLLKKQWSRSRTKSAPSAASVFPGLDSEFYQVERKLIELGLERQTGETLSVWLQRSAQGIRARTEPLPALLALHYRLRFDPKGLSAEERAILQRQVRLWLDQPLASDQSG